MTPIVNLSKPAGAGGPLKAFVQDAEGETMRVLNLGMGKRAPVEVSRSEA